MRRSITVVELKNKVNGRLRETGPNDVQYRVSDMHLLEWVLHETGNYKGYYYLHEKDIKGGNPGIRPDCDDMFNKTDPTRVNYY